MKHNTLLDKVANNTLDYFLIEAFNIQRESENLEIRRLINKAYICLKKESLYLDNLVHFCRTGKFLDEV